MGTTCDDRNLCTTNDRCAVVSGSPRCVGSAGSENMLCSDENECTAQDHCQAGVCVGQTLADGAHCDDGSRCTADAGDMCVAGECVGGAMNTCSTSGLTSAECEPSDGLCCGRRPSGGTVCR